VTSPRHAAFLAVGSELLRAGRSETNSLLAARLLGDCGFSLVEKRAVEDDAEAVGRAARELASRVELVLISGGLGPTADDVTREGVAAGFELGIQRLAPLESALAARYRSAGRQMPAIAGRMADVLEGAEVLPNPQGTAPGQLLHWRGASIVLLPGVPRELETIFVAHLQPRLAGSGRYAVRTLHLAGVWESAVEDRVSGLYARHGRERATILAGRGLVDLVLAACGAGAESELAEMEGDYCTAAGADLFGRDRETLPGVVLGRLKSRGWMLATAESCTGGLVGAQLTAVAGASDAYAGGVVAYANALKTSLLGVGEEVLAERGAVSREAAVAMAQGAMRLGAHCGLAVTGIAGPTGGSAEKPVGTVHIAAITPAASRSAQFRFPGDRAVVQEVAANFALDLLRRLLEQP
jgi:nicotinamide-nucleotide amidase